jgi:hypothetical protein
VSLRVPREMEVYRRLNHAIGVLGDNTCGFFIIPNRGLRIMVSAGEGWEHASVSLADRCPTWDELEWVKRKFWSEDDTVMQLHVPPSDHKSLHPYCLHLWRPMFAEIPRPPSIMVAP